MKNSETELDPPVAECDHCGNWYLEEDIRGGMCIVCLLYPVGVEVLENPPRRVDRNALPVTNHAIVE